MREREDAIRRTFLIGAAALTALAVRVIPAWHKVFTPGEVHFQEGDAWIHMRVTHNLVANFPHRSGFDPYLVHPTGLNISPGPLWDYLVACVAWIVSAGSPGEHLTEQVAAWLPAIVGALFPIPVYFLARRLFGATAAAFAALWIALAPGGFLWATHLGLADHHATETLFAFLALMFVCFAVDSQRLWYAVAAGVSLGAFLATRPGGVFVPAILACAVLWSPEAALPVLITAAVASALFFPASGAHWAEYTWLVLAVTAGAAALSLALSYLARRRNWTRATRQVATLSALAVAAAGAICIRPGLVVSLWAIVRSHSFLAMEGKETEIVQELQTIFRAGDLQGLSSVLQLLGIIWILALPALVVVSWRAVRHGGFGLRLFALWSLVITIGTAAQARMVIYFFPVAAILAGAACARVPRFRAAVAALIVVATLPGAISQTSINQGVSQDWRQAMYWLRNNTPEPFGDASKWWRYHPRLKDGVASSERSRWGVAVWWDRGYLVEYLARRVPLVNGGFSASLSSMARFYLETDSDSAVEWLRKNGARYVIVDPRIPLFADANRSIFPAAVKLLRRDPSDYFRVFAADAPGGARLVPVYLEKYYWTMGARLYLNDGLAVRETRPWVFETEAGGDGAGNAPERVVYSREFASAREAAEYVAAHPDKRLTVGCVDPGVSCFALPPVAGLRQVFTTDPLPPSPKRTVHAVKVFELTAP